MRTGADYRDTLRRDGRKVWVLGEGLFEDVTTQPATSAMVEEYVAWYDRHLDPAWQDILFAPATPERERAAWAYVLPKTSDDLIGMGRSFAKTIFLSAGRKYHDNTVKIANTNGEIICALMSLLAICEITAPVIVKNMPA